MRNALFLVITQRVMVISPQRFGTTYLSHHHGSRIQIQILLDFRIFLNSWPLKIGPIGCPETSVRNYHYSLRNNSWKRSSHLLQGGSLQSHIYLTNFKLCFIFKEEEVFNVAVQILSYWVNRRRHFRENKRKKTSNQRQNKIRILNANLEVECYKANSCRRSLLRL